jgi:hypothetical protein
MAHPGDSPDSGYAKMYTGKPSKPGKLHTQTAYGIVKGDGVGFEDVADSVGTGKIKYGAVDGKRRKVEDELEQS